MKTVAIIQARMGASRLPNKMLLHLHGYPIVEWVYQRVKKAKKIDQILFALPDTKNDDLLANYLQEIGVKVFRGSELDLVDRYCQAAASVSAGVVVRICADNPLICPTEIDKLIDFFSKNKCDYAYNHIPKGNSYPDGLGAEICSTRLLKEISQKSIKSQHREHLFNYIWDNQSYYKIQTFEPSRELSHPGLKFDLDTLNDYQKLLEKPYRINMISSEVIKTAIEQVIEE